MTDNYCIDRKIPTPNELILYFEEVSGTCPNCGEFLMLVGKKQTKNFEIAHIYPCSPTAWERGILIDVERLGEDSEDSKNKIALCLKCHKLYDDRKTLEEYNELLNKKKTLLEKHSSKIELSATPIDDQINEVLSSLGKIGDDEFISLPKLSYEALQIKEKIGDDYVLFRREITDYVTNYYLSIREQFKTLDEISQLNFNKIAAQVKLAYLTCTSKTKDKEDVFMLLVNWLITKTQGSENACRIIVSFFVQNCEVYDKVSK